VGPASLGVFGEVETIGGDNVVLDLANLAVVAARSESGDGLGHAANNEVFTQSLEQFVVNGDGKGSNRCQVFQSAAESLTASCFEKLEKGERVKCVQLHLANRK